MLDWLHRLDVALFHFLNVRIQNTLFDVVMPYLTKTRHWRIPIGLLWLALMLRGGRKGRHLALVLVPTIAAIDIALDQIVKPAIGRVRPCRVFQDVHLLVGCQSSFSFPSNHAANLFAGATLFAACYGRKIGLVCFTLASVVGFSRVYVGAHYPFDVLGGAVLGVAWGLIVSVLWRTIEGRRGEICL